MLGIGHSEIRLESGSSATTGGSSNRDRSEINTGGDRTVLQPFQVIGPQPDADFQNSFPAGEIESRKLRNVWFESVTCCGVGAEPSGRIKVAGSARFSVPEVANLLFQFL